MTPSKPCGEALANHGHREAGVLFAAGHLVAVFISSVIAQQAKGWAGVFVWPVWLVIDLPWSLPCYLVVYETPLNVLLSAMRASHPVLDYVLYPPYFIHGVIGTIWWGMVPRAYLWFRHRRLSRGGDRPPN